MSFYLSQTSREAALMLSNISTRTPTEAAACCLLLDSAVCAVLKRALTYSSAEQAESLAQACTSQFQQEAGCTRQFQQEAGWLLPTKGDLSSSTDTFRESQKGLYKMMHYTQSCNTLKKSVFACSDTCWLPNLCSHKHPTLAYNN
eukprot:6200357-Pleurochrysis_carterae.AAC.8